MTRLQPVVRYALRVYVVLLLLAMAAVVGAVKLQHVRVLSVQSGSMRPVFDAGDAVVVRPLGPGGLRSGQVVSYVSPVSGQIISHRVVQVDTARGQLTTRGDALAKADTPIRQTALIGRVVWVLPHAGSILDFMKQPLGLALFVYAPALGIVAGEARNLSHHYGRGYYRLLGFR